MKILKIMFVIALLVSVSFLGSFFYERSCDAKIAKLQTICEYKQRTVDALIADAYKTDKQSEIDECYMDAVFDDVFTFYSRDDFDKARSSALEWGLPVSFVNRFYDTAELTGMYADSMLDIMCKYDSADFYLLDRKDDIGYYFAVVKLDTVKYSNSRFELGFFIAIKNHGVETERFSSVVYYNIV